MEFLPNEIRNALIFVYIVRDRKWKNGHLKSMAEKILKGNSINNLMDFPTKEKRAKWFKEVLEELEDIGVQNATKNS